MTVDRSYLQALQTGQPAALDRFYRDHARQVLGWSIRLGGPHIDAEDVAQEVFAIALRKIGSFRGDSALSTWLFVVTRNVIANARRRAAVRRLVGLDGDMDQLPHRGDGADDEVDRLRRRRLVQHALERLKQPQREVLVLMDLEGRTAPETAELLGVPEGTVYSRLHYARQAFRDALRREGITSVESAGIGVPVREGGKS